MSEITPETSVSEETVTVPKKQYDEIVEKLADRTQASSNLVSEVQELRKKNQLSESEKQDLLKKLEQRAEAPVDGQASPERIAEIASDAVAKALAAREEESTKTNSENALKAFIASHGEFNPENDEGGLKMSMLQRKVEQFNTKGLKTESDFLTVLTDAYKLVSSTAPSNDATVDPNPPAPMGARGTEIRTVDDNKLSPKELAIIDRSFDGNRERYLKLRAKRPDYVAQLLQYASL